LVLGDLGVDWAPSTRTFNVLVLGDSIMWGQGLREEDKFTSLVVNWIKAQLPGTLVNVTRYAHSGAVIAPDEGEDAKAAKHGEVPSAYPSITAQFWTAASRVLPDRPIDLVLMDGGISDLTIETILATDATVAGIRSLTRERCVARLERLLPYVLQKFPIAKVVTAGYFPIVSSQTDLPLLTEFLGTMGIPGPVTISLRSKLGEQSLAFHEAYVAGIRAALLNARPLEVVSSAPTKPLVPRPSAVSGTTALAVRRTAFAVPPFRPENSYGAPNTWLWKALEPDPVQSERAPQCVLVGEGDNPKCRLAAIGHPNVRGAQEYARAIIRELEQFLPEWRQTFGAAAPRRP
jgi:hypothetical protein